MPFIKLADVMVRRLIGELKQVPNPRVRDLVGHANALGVGLPEIFDNWPLIEKEVKISSLKLASDLESEVLLAFHQRNGHRQKIASISPINKSRRIYAVYDSGCPDTREFAKFFVGNKKDDLSKARVWDEQAKRIKGRGTPNGSGNWVFSFKGNNFSVMGKANGRGIWGTDYHLEKMMEEES